ncbi:unnamed protein product [Amoebophrya sp. A120]|nr:unnamed protein product [Amoebophrya sp. A120]|eukprot:GSA120T00001689001.1
MENPDVAVSRLVGKFVPIQQRKQLLALLELSAQPSSAADPGMAAGFPRTKITDKNVPGVTLAKILLRAGAGANQANKKALQLIEAVPFFSLSKLRKVLQAEVSRNMISKGRDLGLSGENLQRAAARLGNEVAAQEQKLEAGAHQSASSASRAGVLNAKPIAASASTSTKHISRPPAPEVPNGRGPEVSAGEEALANEDDEEPKLQKQAKDSGHDETKAADSHQATVAVTVRHEEINAMTRCAPDCVSAQELQGTTTTPGTKGTPPYVPVTVPLVHRYCEEVATAEAVKMAHDLLRSFVIPTFCEELLESEVVETAIAAAVARDKRMEARESILHREATDHFFQEVVIPFVAAAPGSPSSGGSSNDIIAGPVLHRLQWVQPPGLSFSSIAFRAEWQERVEDWCYTQCRRAILGSSTASTIHAASLHRESAAQKMPALKSSAGSTALLPGEGPPHQEPKVVDEMEAIRQVFRQYAPAYEKSFQPQSRSTAAAFWRDKVKGKFTKTNREILAHQKPAQEPALPLSFDDVDAADAAERRTTVGSTTTAADPAAAAEEHQQLPDAAEELAAAFECRIPEHVFYPLLERSQICASCVFGLYQQKTLFFGGDREAYSKKADVLAKAAISGKRITPQHLMLPPTDFAIISLEEELRVRCGLLVLNWAAEMRQRLPGRGSVDLGKALEAEADNAFFFSGGAGDYTRKNATSPADAKGAGGVGNDELAAAKTEMDCIFVDILTGKKPAEREDEETPRGNLLGDSERAADTGRPREVVDKPGDAAGAVTNETEAPPDSAAAAPNSKAVRFTFTGGEDVSLPGRGADHGSDESREDPTTSVLAAPFQGETLTLSLRRVFEVIEGRMERDYLMLFDHQVLHQFFWLAMHEFDATGAERLLCELSVVLDKIVQTMDAETVGGQAPLTTPVITRLLDFLLFGATGAYFDVELRIGMDKDAEQPARPDPSSGTTIASATATSPKKNTTDAAWEATCWHFLQFQNGLELPNEESVAAGGAPAPIPSIIGFFRPVKWKPFFCSTNAATKDPELVDCTDRIDHVYAQVCADFSEESARTLFVFSESARAVCRAKFRKLIQNFLDRMLVIQNLRFPQAIPVSEVFQVFFGQKAATEVEEVCDRVLARRSRGARRAFGSTSSSPTGRVGRTSTLGRTKKGKLLKIRKDRLLEIRPMEEHEDTGRDDEAIDLAKAEVGSKQYTRESLQLLVDYSELFEEELSGIVARAPEMRTSEMMRHVPSRLAKRYCGLETEFRVLQQSSKVVLGAKPKSLASLAQTHEEVLRRLDIPRTMLQELAFLWQTNLRAGSQAIHAYRVAEIVNVMDAALSYLALLRMEELADHGSSSNGGSSFSLGRSFLQEMQRNLTGDRTREPPATLGALLYFCDAEACRAAATRVCLRAIMLTQNSFLKQRLCEAVAAVLSKTPARSLLVSKIVGDADDREDLADYFSTILRVPLDPPVVISQDSRRGLFATSTATGPKLKKGEDPCSPSEIRKHLLQSLFEMGAPDLAAQVLFWLQSAEAAIRQQKHIELEENAEVTAKRNLYRHVFPEAFVIEGLFQEENLEKSALSSNTLVHQVEDVGRYFQHPLTKAYLLCSSTGPPRETVQHGIFFPDVAERFLEAADDEIFSLAYELEGYVRDVLLLGDGAFATYGAENNQGASDAGGRGGGHFGSRGAGGRAAEKETGGKRKLPRRSFLDQMNWVCFVLHCRAAVLRRCSTGGAKMSQLPTDAGSSLKTPLAKIGRALFLLMLQEAAQVPRTEKTSPWNQSGAGAVIPARTWLYVREFLAHPDALGLTSIPSDHKLRKEFAEFACQEALAQRAVQVEEEARYVRPGVEFLLEDGLPMAERMARKVAATAAASNARAIPGALRALFPGTPVDVDVSGASRERLYKFLLSVLVRAPAPPAAQVKEERETGEQVNKQNQSSMMPTNDAQILDALALLLDSNN